MLVVIKYAHPHQGWVSFLFPDMRIPISADYQAKRVKPFRTAVGITDVRYLTSEFSRSADLTGGEGRCTLKRGIL